MEEKINIPSLGESIEGGVIASWLKNDGDYVTQGEELFELESDKATLTVPSTSEGTLHILKGEDSEVKIGETVATIDTAAIGIAAVDTAAVDTAAAKNPPTVSDKKIPSPAVRRIVSEYGIPSDSIKGSGPSGRVLKEDALDLIKSPESAAPAEPGDRIQKEKSTPPARREKMSRLRKTIAENLVRSKSVSAHLTTFNEIDMSRVMEIRNQYQSSFREAFGIKIGFMPFFVKACTAALRKYPQANAFIEGDEIIYNDYYNLGIAVSTEGGLVVPVLKGAGEMSLDQIETQIADFARKAGEKKLSIDDLTGGTFTITNGGIFGSLFSTPIPSPPQSAILGMHSIKERPVVIDGSIVVRPMMYAALTYDHRIMDGREAVGFLQTVKEGVEDPFRLFLNI